MALGALVSDAQVKLNYDTNYIKRYYRSLCLTLMSHTMEYRFKVRNVHPDGQDIVYNTNNPIGIGIEVDYKWLSVGYTYSVAHLNNTGNNPYTQVRSLQLGANGRWYWARAFIQSQQGLYLTNADGFSLHPDPANRRNDMKGVTFIGNANYIFNSRKYSHNASLWQVEQQLKSAGSFTAGVAVNVYSMKADSPFVPSALGKNYGQEGGAVSALTQSYAINAGYLYTLVIRKTGFVHVSAIPGLCIQHNASSLATGEERVIPFQLGTYGEGRIAAGYNGPKFYAGANVVAYLFSEKSFDFPIQHSYSFFRLFLGMRIPLKVKIPMEDTFE
jgi:hypothetical protein